MIHFKINEQDYQSYEGWNEITLDKSISMSTLFRSAPKPLLDYYTLMVEPVSKEQREANIAKWSEGLEDEIFIKDIPAFYGKAICELSNVPEEVMESVTIGYRRAFYKQHCELFVIGILHSPIDYEVKELSSFIYKGVEYQMPITRNILGNDREMDDRKTFEFTESADLLLASLKMEAGKYHFCKNIISILCRPLIPIDPKKLPKLTINNVGKINSMSTKELEPYDEKVCLERAETFGDLKIDIWFEVFFWSVKHILLSEQHSQISQLQIQLAAQKEQLSKGISKNMDGTPPSHPLRVV